MLFYSLKCTKSTEKNSPKVVKTKKEKQCSYENVQ